MSFMRRLLSSAPTESTLALNLTLAAMCIVCAALANGLTQGLLSINPLEMAIKLRSGTPEEKAQASRILPIISRHHFLLCTLMLFNASANEALPIFLDAVVPSWLSIVLSVTLVLICGEILPGAVFTGPSQIKIASTLTPLTIGLMGLLSPIAYPLSLSLDYFLGTDDGMTVYNRYEIAAMMQIQHEEAQKGEHRFKINNIQVDEVNIIDGALKFRDTKVAKVMTPAEKIFTLPITGRLNFKTMSEIFKSGFSRIPICGAAGKDDIVALMLVKDLIFIDPDDETPIVNFIQVFGRPVQTVWPDQLLHEVLKVFRQGKGHMAIVKEVNSSDLGRDPFYETVGIITLEDIIGEILGEDIADETDASDQLHKENRDIDLARLVTLIGPLGTSNASSPSSVSLSEATVIANHLLTTLPQCRLMMGPSIGAKKDSKRMIDLVLSCPLIAVEKGDHRHPQEVSEEREGEQQEAVDYLYQRNKPSSTCTLILHGKVTVLAGKDGFKVELGAWDSLGADALLDSEEPYVPDFTAYISSDSFRCLQISRALWKAVSAKHSTRSSRSFLTNSEKKTDIKRDLDDGVDSFNRHDDGWSQFNSEHDAACPFLDAAQYT